MADIQKQKQNISITPDSLQIETSGNAIIAISGHPLIGTGGGIIYRGDNINITANQDTHVISLTDEASAKLNRIYAPLSVTGDIEYLSGEFNNYYKKTETSSKEQLSDEFEKYQLKTDMEFYATDDELSDLGDSIRGSIDNKQDKLTFGYNSNGEISGIGDGSTITAIAGGTGGDGNYSAGIDLKIENNIISVDTNGNPHNDIEKNRNFVEGSWTEASGYNSHAEGMATTAYGYAVHAQGMWTKFSSSKWYDTQHPTPVDIYWADGAGASVEGYCNATTSCPMSGTEGASDYGPIHGGVLKVIGNGNVVHDTSVDPDAHDHTLQPSDALIIFKDGTISAFGDIYNNGKKYVTEDSISSYNVTAQQGVEVTPKYDSTNKTITFGISITSTPVVTDTTLSGYNGIAAAKDGHVSGQWNVGLTNEMLNTINGKLDSTAAAQTYQTKGDYVSATDITDMATKTWVEEKNYLTEVPSEYVTDTELQTTLGDYATKTLVQNTSAAITALIPSTAGLASETDLQIVSAGVDYVSAHAITAHQSLTNYYTKSETSGATEISTALGDKVDKPNTSLKNNYLVLRTNNDGSVSGWVDILDKVYSKSEADGTFVHRDMLDNGTGGTLTGTGLTGGTVLGVNTNVIQTKLTDEQLSAISEVSSKLDRADLDDYVPYSATKLAIGSNNDISVNNSDNTFAQGTNNKVSTSPYSFVQGEANSAVNYYSLAQGYGNYAQDHSLAQGSNNTAISVSFAQGQNCTAESYTFTQGTNNSAVTTSFAQGSANKARYDSFAQGNRNSAFSQSLAQGHYNSADDGSLAQGKHNTAYSHSFAQGSMNYADNNAMAQGGDNTAKYFSQALGFGLSIQGSRGASDGDAYISGGLAIGTYNQTSAGVAFVVGNGHSNGAGVEPTRSDAFLIYPDGSVSARGDISANGVKLGPGGGGDLSNYVPFSATELPIGTNNTATNTAAAIGVSNTASIGSFALGKENTATNTACAIGSANSAGNGSFVAGRRSTAYDASVAFEESNYASGRSVAFGHSNTAKNYSFTFGRGLGYTGNTPEQWNMGAFVVGCWNNTTTWDYANNSAGSPLFIVGNGGSDSNTKDAFIVYRNGAVNAGYVNTNTVNGSYSFIEGRDNHDVGTAGCNHIEGGYNSLSGLYSHAEGNLNRMSADHSHIEGYRNEFNTSTYDWGIHIGGMLNATTAQTNDHGGILRLIGNGTRHKSGGVEITARSDAYILYRDGTVKAKDFIAGGDTLSANYPVPKTIPNTADNTLKVQRMFVCTSDNDIIAHVNAGLAEGEGCVFFRVGN